MPNTKVTGDLIAQGTIHSVNLADGSVTATKLHNISTDHISEGTNLFYTDARVSTYLSSNNYITSSAISNSANWDAAYSWGDHALVGYLTTETDPVFTTSAASAITSTQITNWDTAYGWGNHATQSYATETYVNTSVANLVDSAPATLDTLNELAAALGDDPNFATTVSTSIGTKWTQDNTKISNWDTAFGWGNHASAGYLTSFTETDPTVPSHVKSITTTNISNWNTAYGWGNHASAGYLTSFDITTQTDPKYLRNDIYNGANNGLQVFRNIGTIAPSWPDASHTFSLENSDAGYLSINFHRGGYTSNNIYYTGAEIIVDAIYRSTVDLRAPIFYDSNNTVYYVDPNSSGLSSRLNGNIEVYARSATWAEGVRIRVPVTNTWGGIRWTRDRVNNDGNWALGYKGAGDTTDDLVFWANNGGSEGDKARMDKAGNFTAVASSRAPIFYDSNDTNTYFDSNRLVIRGGDPTIILRDTNHNSAMLHCNSNLLYVLRGANDTTTWTQVNGQWPAIWNLTNNLYSGGGAATFVGDVTANTSDRRLKENIKNIPDAIKKVKSLNGVTFDWKDNLEEIHYTRQRIHDVGVIAQEVQAVLPDAVRPAPFDTDEEGNSRSGENYLTVQYEKIVPLLIEAVKELSNKVEELENKLNGTD
jgi:hypothetical protein